MSKLLVTRPMHIDMLLLDFTFHFGCGHTRPSENECWLWTRAAFQTRSGKVSVTSYKHVTYIASRVAYFIYYKKDPGQLLVCHSCDNALCVNPKHLFLGTHFDNNLDCKLKGRNQRGENHYAAKLTDLEVQRLRELWATGLYTTCQLGEMFSIAHQTVSKILLNQRRT